MQNLIPVCMYDENESHEEAAEISMVPFPAGLFSHTPLHTVVPDFLIVQAAVCPDDHVHYFCITSSSK